MREAMLKSDPDNVDFRYRLGRSYEALGRERELSGDAGEGCRMFLQARDLISAVNGKIAAGADLERLAGRIAPCRR